MKHHKWTDIKALLKSETRTSIELGAHELAEELHLAQLRKAKGLTQEAMAELLGVSQAARFSDGVEVPMRLGEGDKAA